MFKLNETFIAEKLIHCLLDRSGGSFSSKAMQKQRHILTRKRVKHDRNDSSEEEVIDTDDDDNDNGNDNDHEVNKSHP